MAIARQKTRQRELREARALIRRVQRGDRRAFELLYTAYEGRVYRFCHRLTGDDRTAAALVELTFARALANLPEDGFETLDVPAYLLATARSLGLRAQRQSPRSRPDSGAGEVAAANQRLSPQERAVLVLRDLEGRPDDEIARVARRPGAGCSGPRRHGAPAPARRAAAARDRRCLPGPAARAVGLCRRHAGGRGASRARASRHRLRELPRRTVRPARGRVALRDAARARAARRSRLAHRHCARRGRPAGARTAAAEPVAGGGRKTAVAVAMGALALVGVGVTIAAAATTMHRREPHRPRPRCRHSPRHSRARRCPTRPWRSAPSACL